MFLVTPLGAAADSVATVLAAPVPAPALLPPPPLVGAKDAMTIPPTIRRAVAETL